MSAAVLSAARQIRKMRGGSQAHLMHVSDGNYYVVKFQNCPYGVRVLANELLASRLAQFLGLPVAEVNIIEVPDWLISQSPELHIEMAGLSRPCAAGLQLGSRYAAELGREIIFDYLPKTMIGRVINRHDFSRILPFDKWVGNCDGRQAVFTKRPYERKYYATFIDHGWCFNADQWSFPDLPLLGTYHNVQVYHAVTGWQSFEPVLSQIEDIDYGELWKCAAEIPHEWFEHNGEGLFSLIEALYRRRSLVRELIIQFRNSGRNPFPNWTASTFAAGPGLHTLAAPGIP